MPRVAVPDLPTQPGLEYNAMAGGVVKGTFCHQFRYQELVKSTSYTQRDYYFTNPPYRQEHRYNRPEDNGAKRDYDLYDYPGRYKFDAQGKPFTQYRMEANRVDASTASGTTNAIHLMPGHNMELTAHPGDDYNIKYHLLAVSHHGSQPQALEEEAGEGGATTYSASFHAMPARLPYRPPQRHKPFVEGIQHAMVVGPEGEEIYCDEFGRVKVQFKWDRYGKNDEHSSCWVRVASHWAGTQWGHVSVPRINQEVIVGFYDGDPDQPVIIGRTYNARNQFPYKLPDHKTRMTFKSDTHKGDGFNELRFEDEGGREELFIHAQKDMNTIIQNEYYQNIGNSKYAEIGRHKIEQIRGDLSIQSHGTADISSYSGLSISAGYPVELSNAKKSVRLNASSDSSLFQKAKSLLGSALSTITTGGISISALTNIIETIGVSKTTVVGSISREAVGQNKIIHAGELQQYMSGGTTMIASADNTSIEAGARIDIVCGNASIRMKNSGEIEIKGTKISLN